MSKITTYLKQTKAEMAHVVWPSRNRAIAYTIIVIACSVIVGYLIGGIDGLLKEGLKTIIFK